MEGLPTRIHIGTQKAGSTYLYNLLSTHPNVCLSLETEINYFSDKYEKGIDWYKNIFPKIPTNNSNSEKVLIDCSPTYFKYGREAALRIKETYGANAAHLRFVLILRDPIEYVHSHFLMQKQQGYFYKRPDIYPVPPDTLAVMVRLYPQYLKRARYTELLDEWLQYFSREQFLIIPFEEMKQHEQQVMSTILQFWGLPAAALTSPQISQNRALRFGALAKLRDFVIHRPRLKEYVKKSRLAAFVLNRFLTISTKEKLSGADKAEIAALLNSDIQRLKTEYRVDVSRWA